MIIKEEEFLEHYGVKGQQWGVTNRKRTPTNSIGTPYKDKRPGPVKQAGRRVARHLIGAANIAAAAYIGWKLGEALGKGVGLAHEALTKHGKTPMTNVWTPSGIRSRPAIFGQSAANASMKSYGAQPMSAFTMGPVGSTQSFGGNVARSPSGGIPMPRANP